MSVLDMRCCGLAGFQHLSEIPSEKSTCPLNTVSLHYRICILLEAKDSRACEQWTEVTESWYNFKKHICTRICVHVLRSWFLHSHTLPHNMEHNIFALKHLAIGRFFLARLSPDFFFSPAVESVVTSSLSFLVYRNKIIFVRLSCILQIY